MNAHYHFRCEKWSRFLSKLELSPRPRLDNRNVICEKHWEGETDETHETSVRLEVCVCDDNRNTAGGYEMREAAGLSRTICFLQLIWEQCWDGCVNSSALHYISSAESNIKGNERCKFSVICISVGKIKFKQQIHIHIIIIFMKMKTGLL